MNPAIGVSSKLRINPIQNDCFLFTAEPLKAIISAIINATATYKMMSPKERTSNVPAKVAPHPERRNKETTKVRIARALFILNYILNFICATKSMKFLFDLISGFQHIPISIKSMVSVIVAPCCPS